MRIAAVAAVAAVALTGLACLTAPAHADPHDEAAVLSGDELLDRIVDPVAAARPLPAGVRVVQHSSRDRRGGNVDGGSYGGAVSAVSGQPRTFVRREDGAFVVLDQQRPGCLTRIWLTGSDDKGQQGSPARFGRLQLFVDGEQRPSVDLPAVDFFAGRDARFPQPLVGDHEVSSGGNYSNVPFCFARSLKVRFTGDLPDSMSYYQLTVLEAPPGAPVRPYAATLATRAAAERLKRAGEPPGGAPEVDVRRRVEKGTVPLARLDGAGSIRHLRIGVEPFDIDTLQSLELRVAADGATPQISVPLGALFGDGLAVRPIRSSAFGMSPQAKSGYFSIPIPFARSASVWVVAGRPAHVRLEAWRGAAIPGAGILHGERRVQKTELGDDVRVLDAAGSGRLVSLVLDIVGDEATAANPLQSFLEGDERVHVDGARSPSIHGTGTEDFFNGGYYYKKGAFTLPTHGAGALVTRPVFRGAQSQYRVLLGDPIVWSREIALGMEHGGGDEDPDRTVASTTFSYRGATQLTQTDAIEPGDQASETAHALTGAFTRQTLSAYFEGDRDGSVPVSTRFIGGFYYPAPPPQASPEGVTDEGIEFRTPVSFDIALDPSNEGAVLRRVLDQGSESAVDVLVDGQPAGRWAVNIPAPDKRWLEDDFALPWALTAGKRHIRVTLAPAGGSAATAFGLVAFSRHASPD
jgi:hypothetical protein